MSATERRFLSVGVALLALATPVLEVATTRLLTALVGQGIACAVGPAALIAGAIGAAIAASRRPREGDEVTSSSLSRLPVVCSAASIAALVAVIALAFATGPGGKSIAKEGLAAAHPVLLGALGIALAAPFALAGWATARALARTAASVATFVLAWFGGGALGCLAAVMAVRAGAPRAVLIAAVVLALAAVAMLVAQAGERAHAPDGEPSTAAPPPWGIVATAVLGALVLLAGDLGAPWLKLRTARPGVPDKPDVTRWTELGLFTVDRPSGGSAWIRRDGERHAPIVDGKVDPPARVEDMAFVLEGPRGPVMIVDAAGGRPVRAALRAGHSRVVAVVTSPVVANEILRGELREYSGGIYGDARVEVQVGDGRGSLRRSAGSFQAILVDVPQRPEGAVAVAPTAPNAALTEAGLHTIEAYEQFFERLEADGLLVVTRPVEELARALEVAAHALGVPKPEAHAYACDARGEVAIAVKRSPLSRADLRALRTQCKRAKGVDAFAPDATSGRARDALDAFVAARASGVAARADLPSDDRPFQLASARVAASEGSSTSLKKPAGPRTFAADAGTRAALAATMAAACTAVGLGVAAARWLRRRSQALEPMSGANEAAAAEPRSSWGFSRVLGVLAGIGLSLAWLEVVVVRELSGALGHPVHGLALVLPMMLLAYGFGGQLAARVEMTRVARTMALWGAASCLLLGGLAVSLPSIARGIAPLALPVRLSGALALAMVVGAIAGTQLPLALRLAAGFGREGAAWGFGGHLVGRALGAALAPLVILDAGFGALLFAAAVALGLSALGAPSPQAQPGSGPGSAAVSDPITGAESGDDGGPERIGSSPSVPTSVATFVSSPLDPSAARDAATT